MKKIVPLLFIAFGFILLLVTIWALAYSIIYSYIWSVILDLMLIVLNMTTILQAVNMLLEMK